MEFPKLLMVLLQQVTGRGERPAADNVEEKAGEQKPFWLVGHISAHANQDRELSQFLYA